MRGKKASIITGITGVAICLGLVWGFQVVPDHKLLFEKAKFAMETTGDLPGAIKLFQEIVTKYPQEKEHAAKAQLYIGLCYEKLGNSEAVKAYELVLKNFSDRPEEVAVARERLAALRQEEGGGIIKKNLPISEIEFVPFALSPDGTKILGISSDEQDDIAVLDIATGRTELLTHFDSNLDSPSADEPVWSPDGKRIAYSQVQYKNYPMGPAELRAMTLDGETRLLCRFDDGDIWPCEWLRDGRSLVVVRMHKDRSYTLGLVTLPDRAFRSLCPVPPPGMSRVYASASPDGRYIAFADNNIGHKNIHIFSFDRQESYVLIDHPANDTAPRWSPDGKHLVFLSNRHGRYALWGQEMREGRAAGEPLMIKEAKPGSLLNWTSHGLAFYEYLHFNNVLIQAFNPQAREVTGKPHGLIYTPSGGTFSPCWSPDGKLLAFCSGTEDETAQLKIVVMPVGGGDAREFPVPPPAVATHGYPLSMLCSLSWMADSSGVWSAMLNEKSERILMKLDLGTGAWLSPSLPDAARRSTSIVLGRDGNSIIFVQGPSSASSLSIMEYGLETGKEKCIYRPDNSRSTSISSLRFSRDSRSLAFLRHEQGEQAARPACLLEVLDMESGKVHTAYAGPAEVGGPAFSPDGRDLLVFFEDESGWQQGLGLIPAAGGDLRRIKLDLTWPRGIDLHNRLVSLDWSPDGKQVALTAWSIKEEAYLLKNIIPKQRR